MTCMYKDYDVKYRWHRSFYWIITWKLLFICGEWTFGGVSLIGGGFFQMGNNQIFGLSGNSPHPPVEKALTNKSLP